MVKTYTVLGWKRLVNADHKAGRTIVVHRHGRTIADLTFIQPQKPRSQVMAYGVIQSGTGPDFHTQKSMRNAIRAMKELRIPYEEK